MARNIGNLSTAPEYWGHGQGFDECSAGLTTPDNVFAHRGQTS